MSYRTVDQSSHASNWQRKSPSLRKFDYRNNKEECQLDSSIHGERKLVFAQVARRTKTAQAVGIDLTRVAPLKRSVGLVE